MKLIVALGGNAIKQADEEGTPKEQFKNCQSTAEQLGRIIKNFKPGDWIAITHGNGPQSGNLMVQQDLGSDRVSPQTLDVVGAMTQGQIGYMLQNQMQKILRQQGIDKEVVSVVNQVIVDKNDPEFEGENASKPVGNFFTEEEANKLKKERPDHIYKKVKPSADKPWRRVVPSPIPIDNMEKRTIKHLVESGIIVIASGGGGIPVWQDDKGNLNGLEAVIDKDRAGEVMAEAIDADTFLILTDVEQAKINFGKENEQTLHKVTLSEMKKYHQEGHFLAGSMGPKVEACFKFLEKGGEKAIITSLFAAEDALEGKTGTIITKD